MRYALVSLVATLVGCGDDITPVRPDAATAAAPDAGPDASETTVELASAPADWLLLVDRSMSWNGRADRFAGLKDGINAALASRTHEIVLAAASFPHIVDGAASCEDASYAAAELPWQASDTDVATALAAWGITSGSTLGPALAGAGIVANERRAEHPGGSTSIILLTDAAPGEDETCSTSDWNTVAAIAADVFDAGHGATTHVISVMGVAVAPDHPVKVGGIAVAGGGYAAFVNGSQSDVARSTKQALTDLEDRAEICTRVLPHGVNPASISIRSPDGSVTEVTRVDDAAHCSGSTFYTNDPVAPTTATLCSGPGGIGGICELTFVRARFAGAPTFVASVL